MTIHVKPIDGGASSLPKKGEQIINSTRVALQRVTLLLLGRVKEKLSDQVLRVRTGRLRRSITQEVREVDGQLVGQVGTNVNYAPPHEFGMNADVQVREHMQTRKQVFGRMLKSPIQVTIRAHTRHVNLPQRSFLRSALKEMADSGDIPKEFQATIERGN